MAQPGEPARVSIWARVTPRLIIAVVIAVVALVFVFQNTRRTRFDFLFWTGTASGWIWTLTIFVAGVIAGSIFPWFRRKPKG